MPHLIDADITAHDLVAPGHYRLTLHAPEIAQAAEAGQFCMLQVQDGLYPFLRRPMCFETIQGDAFTVFYKVEGEGTRLMSTLRPGQTINVQGPLGKPWPIDAGFRRHVMVAGGIGIATFPGLAAALQGAGAETPEIIIAARTAELLLCVEEFTQAGCRVHCATDDGSTGFHGYAGDLLRQLEPGGDTRVYSCGPMPMMRAVHHVCMDTGADCLHSLEAEMACGDGVCLGCVVQAKVEIEAERMVRVCYDGPVFPSQLIDWDAPQGA